jgi:putative CocE/NonD family hydrolase
MRHKSFFKFWCVLASVLVFPFPQYAQAPPAEPDYSRVFDKQDVKIRMRDGIQLHTQIYTPKTASQPLPILLERTPYGIPEDSKGYTYRLRIYDELIKDGYIFAFQDIRGRFQSEGQFVMLRRPRDPRDPKALDEGTDTYDTIDWLIKNVPHNNGRVGVLGISYGGWLTVMATLEPHPALKAVSEQASPADMYLGDDFHHNGAFRLSYGFEYASEMETDKTNYAFKFSRFDTFEWYLLNLGALSNANRQYFHGAIPTWNAFVEHPNYDAYWQTQAVPPYLKSVTVPNLNVAGWWDQEDFYGPIKIYETLEKHDSQHWNYLVVGPWNHGGWAHGEGRTLGKIAFGSDTSRYFREKVQAPWFAYWLKDQGELPFREALTFQTGSNEWKAYGQWPPREKVSDRKLYLRAGGGLSFDPPRLEEAAFESYLSDPAHPVPYRHRPIGRTYGVPGWSTWLVEDQRFVHLRPDTLSFETEPLTENVCVAGDLVAHLFAATTGTDSDWIVKLIDVDPEEQHPDPTMGGYQLMIADEVFRGRFRHSFETPEPVVANRVTPYRIDLHTNNHCFLPGHRIMVQVQSTWFPLIDRNPQKYVPNIFKATDADYQKATQRVYHSPSFSSYLELPVETH